MPGPTLCRVIVLVTVVRGSRIDVVIKTVEMGFHEAKLPSDS